MSTTAKALLIASLLCLSGCWTPREVFPPMHPHWHVFTSPQARHSADFPGRSKQRLEETRTLSGRTAATYLRELELGNRYYGTAWTLIPADTSVPTIRDRVLEVAAAEAVKSTGGKLVSRHSVTNEGLPGLAYVIDLPQTGTRLRQQVFVATGVLVEQTYSGPAGTEDEREPGRFFDSLKLLP